MSTRVFINHRKSAPQGESAEIAFLALIREQSKQTKFKPCIKVIAEVYTHMGEGDLWKWLNQWIHHSYVWLAHSHRATYHILCIGRSRGHEGCMPLSGPKFLHFCAIFGKNWPNIMLVPPGKSWVHHYIDWLKNNHITRHRSPYRGFTMYFTLSTKSTGSHHFLPRHSITLCYLIDICRLWSAYLHVHFLLIYKGLVFL